MFNRLFLLLEDAGISLTDHQGSQLITYVNTLHKWNKAYNLTSAHDPNETLVRHILDSVTVTSRLWGGWFIDVGTGPGLPGTPLSIICSEVHFILLDSLGKRVCSLHQMQHELKLESIEPVQSKVEKFSLEPSFDGVVSRTSASLNDMVNWCHHPLGEQGRSYVLKEQIPGDEIALLSEEYQIKSVVKLQTPALDDERHPVVIKANKTQFLSRKSRKIDRLSR